MIYVLFDEFMRFPSSQNSLIAHIGIQIRVDFFKVWVLPRVALPDESANLKMRSRALVEELLAALVALPELVGRAWVLHKITEETPPDRETSVVACERRRLRIEHAVLLTKLQIVNAIGAPIVFETSRQDCVEGGQLYELGHVAFDLVERYWAQEALRFVGQGGVEREAAARTI